jgi:hypothetical protein
LSTFICFLYPVFRKNEKPLQHIKNRYLARILHELIWPQMQGAGHEAVVNLPRMSRNTEAAAKAARPKGEFFRHEIGVKYPKPLMTVCLFKNRLNCIATGCV